MDDRSDSNLRTNLWQSLEFLYPGKSSEIFQRLQLLIRSFQKGQVNDFKFRPCSFTSEDALLIAYPDMISMKGKRPLSALKSFIDNHLNGYFSHIHILPFFPSSSDEGFSVMDFHSIDPQYGTWQDMEALGEKFHLVFDLVLNHASARGLWFKDFLEGRPPYDHFFVTRNQETDTSLVFRPRTHPLLTPQLLKNGETVYLWTTFSPDQIDLDFSNPEVFLAMAEVLLEYSKHGAKVIRLDAVAFAWKEEGTNCLNLPQVHQLVKIFRWILESAAPGITLLSETNLPQEINDSYFGNNDEAQLVYRFPLPPLVLHAFIQSNADYLTDWASKLPVPDPRRVYVNFLSSHDGIGVTPVRSILPSEELNAMIDAVKNRGGLVSSRSTPDGPVAYELNTTFFDALTAPQESVDLKIRSLLSAHGLMAAIDGIPAFWFHSLVGSQNWIDGPSLTGSNRSIHRERLEGERLLLDLEDPDSIRSLVFTGIKNLLACRRVRRAFDPGSPQRVITQNRPSSIFGLIRGKDDQSVLILVNVSDYSCDLTIPQSFKPQGLGFDPTDPSHRPIPHHNGNIQLDSKAVVWIDGYYQGDS